MKIVNKESVSLYQINGDYIECSVDGNTWIDAKDLSMDEIMSGNYIFRDINRSY